MHRLHFPAVLLIAVMLGTACSGSGGSPIIPDMSSPGLTAGAAHSCGATTKAVWGVWQIEIDKNSMKAVIVPVRGAQYTVNVVSFLQPPIGSTANLSLQVTDTIDWLTEGKLTCDVGLRHPFPGYDEYTGFDVYGVFMAPGTTGGNYDGDVIYTLGGDDPILLNADGYTRWMNPTEFPDTGTILDFTPGALSASPVSLFTSTINGYKYFCDRLEKDQDVAEFFGIDINTDDRGKFSPGNVNWREYQLDFAMEDDSPLLIFQYAVIASWIEPDPAYSGDPDVLDIPGDFALSANADEVFFASITDVSTLFYDGIVGGGAISLDIEVFDWGAMQNSAGVTGEIHQIVIEDSTGLIPGGYEGFDQATLELSASPGSTSVSSVVTVDIVGLEPSSNDDIPVLITIESEYPDAFDVGSGIPNNDDRLAAYFLTYIPVGNEAPYDFQVIDPNGGEILYMLMDHEITWNTYYPGVTDVKIEWSPDDFASEIFEIVASTENDGSFMWDPVPKFRTESAKIRISDVGGAVTDDSDDYFTIYPPVDLDLQDTVTVDTTSVAFSAVDYMNWDEISPAISQDHDGLVHICWHDEIAYPDDPAPSGHREARDVVIRSMNGDSWNGQGGFLFTWGGTAQEVHELRRDYMKLAPAANNTTFAAVWHWRIYFSLDVDHLINGHNYYNAYCLFNRIYLAAEIMADDDYVYTVSDGVTGIGDGPGIYSYQWDTPNYAWPGNLDPKPPMNTLTNYGEISHSRSWSFQDDLLVMAYWTLDGQIKLLRQTDQAADTWDDTEVIFDGSGYTGCKDPGLCYDSDGRLFVVWTGQENSSSEYHLLVSNLETSSSTWSDPMIIATSTTAFDDQHISPHNAQFELPNGTMEDLLLIGYEIDSQTRYQIVLIDMWDWLPSVDLTDASDVTRDPDAMCLDDSYGYNYDALITWSLEITPGTVGYGDYDIQFVNGNFVIPQ